MKASEYQLAQQSYVSDGMARALALGNRGPLRFDQQGRVHEDILEAYWRTGFYVFENVIDPAEIKLLQTEIESLWRGRRWTMARRKTLRVDLLLARNSRARFTL